mmetsp:Transcript_37098/g.90941  ORF Transcript_37098/g.90941 Transcript_37098/m.90941 type:complete len:163 (-) Transcript_37098:186-674(-)
MSTLTSSTSTKSSASSRRGELKSAFDLFDKNGDGRISVDELSSVLDALGAGTTVSNHVKEMIATVDSDRNGTIEFEEFERALEVQGGVAIVDGDAGEAHWRSVFEMFDADGNGMISPEELKDMMARFGTTVSLKEAREMLTAADLNGDGQLDFSEFRTMLQA